MRVLVTWGSKRGGTAAIGETIAHTLEDAGHDVIAVPARDAPDPRGFDAVIVGSALYASRWRASARRWVERHARDLTSIPTWMFSNAPLDAIADENASEPSRDVRSLMKRIGAVDHHRFDSSTDVCAWAKEIERELGLTRPSPPEELHGHSLVRLFEYGAYGWAICSMSFAVLMPLSRPDFAIVIHAITAPIAFALLARRYQSVDGARTPLAAAVMWTAMVAVLDVTLISAVVRPSFSLVGSVTAYWLPLALVFIASWSAGAVTEMLPVTSSDESRAIRA
jgi:menaquinone-dependent protoporphyrinogen oxidase